MLCVCGRWGGSDYIKKYTICEICHHKAICICGREETLKYWKNEHINKYIDSIVKNGTEGDQQVKVYEESGFEYLKKYLMTSVQY